jgi:type I restriction enzyme R subunit
MERVGALRYKHGSWLSNLPENTANAVLALAGQFAKGGTEELENPHIFDAPDVVKAGGIQALGVLGKPKDIIHQTKQRLFAA